ncbi:MAG TPA: chloride channel protein [Polyangiales bacterium]|nr:chloride channel protein [Polyangiales bacterium]
MRELAARVLQVAFRFAPEERHRLFVLTIVIGGVCGLAAVSFHAAIRFAEQVLIGRALNATGAEFYWTTLLVPTVGALLSGALLCFVAPAARGSGIPQVKYIYAVKSGRVRLRDAASKFVLATLQIGSGASLGREGPTVHICAGIASWLGRVFAISPQNMRRLLPVGAAAGIAAAFNAPIAAVTFVVEEIIGDLDQTLLSGVVVAAALAAVIERSVLGEHPVFDVPGTYGLSHASSLLVYAALGGGAALASHVFYDALLGLRAWFRARPWVWAQPAVGGAVTGLLAIAAVVLFDVRGVTGDGYQTLSAALAGTLALRVMLALMVAKLVATVFCYSSGGAGGIFAPVLFIGGMLGGSFGHLDQLLLSHTDTSLGAFALVGMGAFFAAVIRAPITSVLIIFEMTGSYGLVLPLMIANSAAYMLARRARSTPIYEALLEQDGLALPRPPSAASTLSTFRVADAMTTEVTTLATDMTVSQALEQVQRLTFTMYPVVDAAQRLTGVVTEARLRRKLAQSAGDELVQALAQAEEHMTESQSLVDAVARMHEIGARQMVVVAESDPTRLVGMIAMSDIVRAHALAVNGAHAPPRETSGGTPVRTVRPAVSWPERSSITGKDHAGRRD